MRVATWNVNSIRARLERVVHWLEAAKPDVLCLQETKCSDEQFPREPLEELGYQVEHYGQRSYNGVALLSRHGLEDVVRGLDGVDDEVHGRRVIGATVGDLMLLDVYVVNGERVGTPKFARKLQWLELLARHMRERYDLVGEKVVVCGDFNVTFDDRDVYDPELWRERILCSTPEREALAGVMQPGLVDAFRRFHEEGGHYTWWDYRTRGFQRGEGLRIDHFLLSEPALAACTGVEVDTRARGGERPSDHAPVIATFR
jgi:exodeoxyribonuclease-3